MRFRTRKHTFLLLVLAAGCQKAGESEPGSPPTAAPLGSLEPAPVMVNDVPAAAPVPAAAAIPPGAPEGPPALPPEPTIPKACATLAATKAAKDGIVKPADEKALDTARIQAAIAACPKGQAVKLAADGAKNAFVSGPLKLADGVTLWVDGGATLFASRNPRDFDVDPKKPTCGTNATNDSNGCQALILVDSVANTGVVGEGTLDGRGGEPMLGSKETWWDVAQDAKVKKVKHSNPRIIDVKKAKNFTLYKVRIENGPKFHVVINAEGYVVWGVKVRTPSRPKNSVGKPLTPFYARNTDGIDPSSASNGVIAYSDISVGDDEIAVKGGTAGPLNGLVIAHNHFGVGHGMSIGSETNGGVSNVNVYDLTIDGDLDDGGMPPADLNGIRIKSDSSRGGLVTNVSYTDVCIRGLPNPIILTPHYSDLTGTLVPDYKNIRFKNVFVTKSKKTDVLPLVTLLGNDPAHELEASFDNVSVEGTNPELVKSEFARLVIGPGGVNFKLVGNQVTVTSPIAAGAPGPNRCEEKFAAVKW